MSKYPFIPKELIDIKAFNRWKKRLQKGEDGSSDDDWIIAKQNLEKRPWETLWWQYRKYRKLLLVVVFLFIFVLLITILSSPKLPSWTEFSESITIEKTRQKKDPKEGLFTETKKYQPEKRFLDWSNFISRLAIPILIFYLSLQFQKIDKKKAEDNLYEEAIINYLDSIAKLLLDKELQTELYPDFNKILNKKSSKSFIADAKIESFDNEDNDNHIRDVARIRTITLLRRLEGDSKRQALIIRFLRDTELHEFIFRNANLSAIKLNNAELMEVNFQKANLKDAQLYKAVLWNADFQQANLEEANLEEANLARANLQQANLARANLQQANLAGANLQQAVLVETINLTPKQIKSARFWEKAIYKGYWNDKEKAWEPNKSDNTKFIEDLKKGTLWHWFRWMG